VYDLGYARVVCGAFAQNKASQRVMEKAGMERIPFTEEIEYRGNTHLCVYYQISN
jgi:RimJ/RimL family protein N-acetyltransferase